MNFFTFPVFRQTRWVRQQSWRWGTPARASQATQGGGGGTTIGGSLATTMAFFTACVADIILGMMLDLFFGQNTHPILSTISKYENPLHDFS